MKHAYNECNCTLHFIPDYCHHLWKDEIRDDANRLSDYECWSLKKAFSAIGLSHCQWIWNEQSLETVAEEIDDEVLRLSVTKRGNLVLMVFKTGVLCEMYNVEMN